MMDLEQVRAFVMYNYIPFSKSQCIKRLLIILAASVILCFIGKPLVLWILLSGTICLFSGIIFVALVAKYNQVQISRFLCDGIFWFDMAVLLNLASYRLTALQNGSNWLLALSLISSLMVCIFLSVLMTFSNIKSGKFTKKNPAKQSIAVPMFFGAVGMLTAKSLLQGASQQAALSLLSYILLFLSLVMGIASLNLLKALFCIQHKKR